MNLFLVIILGSILFFYALDFFVGVLNIRAMKKELPAEFRGFYEEKKYLKSQSYLKENTTFELFTNTFDILILVTFILLGGFNYFDKLARSLQLSDIITGLVFVFMLSSASKIASLPFTIYKTFIIEKKYGFNKTTPKTFILDLLKGIVLQLVVGGIVFFVILFLFESLGNSAWIIAWIIISLIQLFLTFIAPVVIMPLFNKFVPLPQDELRYEIENFARSQNFELSEIFSMDGSRRSTKSNAFFTGFGKFKRIVLYDTLIKNHSTQELVSILAHEIGHYKLGHIKKLITISILFIGLSFYLFSLLVNNKLLFEAFKMEELSIYASLVFISILYSPLSRITGLLINIISRKFEYQADLYAVTNYKKPRTFILALKTLSVDNLTNLNPHGLFVFLNYSHPPILDRIKRIGEISKT